jgi:hypothetical protein
MKRILAVTIFATVAVAGLASVTISEDRPTSETGVSFGNPPPPLCPPFCPGSDTKSTIRPLSTHHK